MGAEPVAATWVAGVDEQIAPELAASALLVIDTQVDFVDGGSSPVEGTTAVLPALAGSGPRVGRSCTSCACTRATTSTASGAPR